MEPQRQPHDHRGNRGWWWKLNDYGYPTVYAYRPDDTWLPVEGDPVLLDAIYDRGYDEGGDSVMNDYQVGRWARKDDGMTRSDEVELSIWRHNAEHQVSEPRLTKAEVDDLVRYFVAAEEAARDFLSR